MGIREPCRRFQVPIESLLNQPPPPAPTPLGPTDQLQLKFQEHGRWYYYHFVNSYPYPCDDAEKNRMDAMHEAWYTCALGGQFHIASLRPGRLRILDVGYGTGIWALDMAQRYPEAEIAAIDIGDQHPQTPGPRDYGVRFYPGVDFTQENWGLEDGTFDFVHAAMLCGAIPDWQHFVNKISRLLKPGGQVEFLELDWEPRCDDTAILQRSEIPMWWGLMRNASRNLGKPLEYPEELEAFARGAGCNVINHRIVEVQTSTDTRYLPEDDPQNRLADWYRYVMFSPHLKTFQGMCMALLTRWLGWQPEDVAKLCSSVQATLNAKHSPFHHKLHVVTARKRI